MPTSTSRINTKLKPRPKTNSSIMKTLPSSSSSSSSYHTKSSNSIPSTWCPLPTPPATESDMSYAALYAQSTTASDKGLSSPCSPTSTTHLATPEWASPDLSFRSYLNQLSIDTHNFQEDGPDVDPTLLQQWSKRSLSMSSLGVPTFVRQLSGGKTSSPPDKPSYIQNKRQRQSISINVRLTREKSSSFEDFPVSPLAAAEEEDPEFANDESDSDDNENSRFLPHCSQYHKGGVPKSIYISFPAISDVLDEEPASANSSQQNLQCFVRV